MGYDPGEKNRKKTPVRIIGKDVSCLCCLGGNCHKVGHVLEDCICACAKVHGSFDVSYMDSALLFKREFVSSQRDFIRHIKQEAENGVSNVCFVDAFIVTNDGRMMGESFNIRRKWWAYKEEAEQKKCRRMLAEENGKIRVEEGYCGADGCGRCFRNSGRWHTGEPFIPLNVQFTWVCEFWGGLSKESFRAWDREIQEVKTAEERRKVRSGNDSMKYGNEFQDGRLESGDLVAPGPDEEFFGSQCLEFPVIRRPAEFVRPLQDLGTEQMRQARQWFDGAGITIGKHLSPEEITAVIRLLYTWKDIFVTDIGDLPITDLVMHTIPTYPNAKPHRARDPIYAADEIRWQNVNLPEWTAGKIVSPCTSSWVAKTTWVDKKDTVVDPQTGERWPLRMVHTYCQLNDATLKTNYPMKRIEPILEELSRSSRRYFFSNDAAYGFYAVPLYPAHAYKTAFNTALGQYCYNRMPMGLTGAPATYARLKDIAFGPVPAPYKEDGVCYRAQQANVLFKYFCDDDYGAADGFQELFDFLHDLYFPRLK